MTEKPSLFKTYFADHHRKLSEQEGQYFDKATGELWTLEEQAQINDSKLLKVWRTPNGHYLEVIIDGKRKSLSLIEIPNTNSVFKGDNI